MTPDYPQFVKVQLSVDELSICRKLAQSACRGGRSTFRSEQDRLDSLFDDNLVGQLGQAALNKYWHGDFNGYVRLQELGDKSHGLGGSGIDVPGLNVDVKTSRQKPWTDIAKLQLVVHPRERRSGWVYVFAVAPIPDTDSGPICVTLAGWIADEHLWPPTDRGRFAGCHAVPVRHLFSLPVNPRYVRPVSDRRYGHERNGSAGHADKLQ